MIRHMGDGKENGIPKARTFHDTGKTGNDDAALYKALRTKLGLQQLIGESPAFLAAKARIVTVAPYNTTVLLLGETGTGKEMFARAIHHLSPRVRQPFVPVNCGAIPADLVENELFGHERGAFTGALSTTTGLIHEAEGGTLFLDEVDCLGSLAQVKLLRFLQEKEYRPVGSQKTCRANVRVIAATNTDVERAVQEGRLRADLYFRLNVIPLVLPRLRDRTEDIPLLAHHFLVHYVNEFGKSVTGFTATAMHRLIQHNWPGNIRELEHAIERAVVLTSGTLIDEEHLLFRRETTNKALPSFQAAKAEAIRQFERAYIQEMLAAHQGNITRAAQACQKDRRAFSRLMSKLQISPTQFKSS